METSSMGFPGLPPLLAPTNPPGPVQGVLDEVAESAEPDADVLEALHLPELEGDNTQRIVAFAVSPPPWPVWGGRMGRGQGLSARAHAWGGQGRGSQEVSPLALGSPVPSAHLLLPQWWLT